jgi:hypothetical protein
VAAPAPVLPRHPRRPSVGCRLGVLLFAPREACTSRRWVQRARPPRRHGNRTEQKASLRRRNLACCALAGWQRPHKPPRAEETQGRDEHEGKGRHHGARREGKGREGTRAAVATSKRAWGVCRGGQAASSPRSRVPSVRAACFSAAPRYESSSPRRCLVRARCLAEFEAPALARSVQEGAVAGRDIRGGTGM